MNTLSEPNTLRASRVVLDSERAVCVERLGEGRTVVLVHGAVATRHDMMIDLGQRLSARFDVIAVDRPGHGGSTRPRLDATLLAQATAIRGALQQLGVERPVLVGHSMGGAVVMTYATTWPEEVAGVVALSPLLYPELRMEQVLFGPRATPIIGPMLSRAAQVGPDHAVIAALHRHMFAPQQIPDNWREQFPVNLVDNADALTANGEDAALVNQSIALTAVDYPSCTVPVFLMAGGADQVVDRRRHVMAAARQLPNVRLMLLPGIGHMIHHFAADAVEGAIDDVLRRADGAGWRPTAQERAFELRA